VFFYIEQPNWIFYFVSIDPINIEISVDPSLTRNTRTLFGQTSGDEETTQIPVIE